MGTLYVVGIGPGAPEYLTDAAKTALSRAEVLCGYTLYVELVRGLFPEKEVYSTGMTGEIERCRHALRLAQSGRDIALVCSGDAGVYGMAGLVVDMILDLPENTRPQFEIIAGVSAVNAAAAILGAPLMHDFAIISLSDLMTPWELIKKRVHSAAEADFVIALYNPKSKRRVTQLDEVRQIILQFRDKDTPVGIVTNAGRAGETKIISTLENFTSEEVNMFSLVIVGNSQTFVKAGYMLTPRGYEK